MNEKLADALGYISDKHIAEAAGAKKKKHIFIKVVAAVLAIVLVLNLPPLRLPVSADAVSLAADYEQAERPRRDKFKSYEEFSVAYDAWYAVQNARDLQVQAAGESAAGFYKNGFATFLRGDSNAAWSPINAYMALAVLAETAGGTTRAQILDVLGVDSVETLRERVQSLWESVYQSDGKEVRILANSLWLDESLTYQQDVMDILSTRYYADVYRDDLGSSGSNRAIRTWIDNQTGGFLKDMVPQVDLAPDGASVKTILAMVSTIYFQSKWKNAFSAGDNTTRIFTGPSGSYPTEFMNATERTMTYHWGQSYGAVALSLENGSTMWLILPDEDCSVAQVLAEGEYLAAVTASDAYSAPNSTQVKVNLSLPKFDVESSLDLTEGLKELGITEAFDESGGDFSSAFTLTDPIFVSQVSQATRVAIDEDGVTAASYIEIEWGAGAAMPPEEIIDFVLDRPFLFVIASGNGIPLFGGVVNEP